MIAARNSRNSNFVLLALTRQGSFTSVSSSRYLSKFSQATSKPAFVFDIDGVLLHGHEPIEQAPAALKLLRRHDVPFVLSVSEPIRVS